MSSRELKKNKNTFYTNQMHGYVLYTYVLKCHNSIDFRRIIFQILYFSIRFYYTHLKYFYLIEIKNGIQIIIVILNVYYRSIARLKNAYIYNSVS